MDDDHSIASSQGSWESEVSEEQFVPMDHYESKAAGSLDRLVKELAFPDEDDDEEYLYYCDVSRTANYNWLDLLRISSVAKKGALVENLHIEFLDSMAPSPANKEDLWDALSELPEVNALTFSFSDHNQFLAGDGSADFSAAAFFLRRYRKQLKRLSIKFENFLPSTRVTDELVPALQDLHFVENLTITVGPYCFSKFQEDEVFVALTSMKSLRKLNIIGSCKYTRHSSVEVLANLTELESLSLKRILVSAEELATVIESSRHLTSFSMSNFRFNSSGGFVRFAKVLTHHSSMQTLSLRGNDSSLVYDFWEILATNVGMNNILRSLDIEMILAGERTSEVENRVLQSLVESLQENKALESFSLTQNLGKVKASIYRALGDVLMWNERLKRVEFLCSENMESLCSNALPDLSRSLRSRKSTVESLTFHVGKHKLIGFRSVIEAAERNLTLNRIDLQGCISYNSFAADFISAIESLNGNTTLETIRVRACSCDVCSRNACWSLPAFTEGQKAALKHALAQTFGLHYVLIDQQSFANVVCTLNAAGRKYMVKSNSLEEGVEVLAEVSYTLDALYYHLRENASTFFGAPSATAGSTSKRAAPIHSKSSNVAKRQRV